MLMVLFWEYWHWVMFLLFVLFFLWVYEQSIGIKGIFVTPVYYDVPEGISVMTAGMLYDNFTDYKDFIAGVLELSVKGYVEMKHKSNGNLYVHKTEKPYGRLRDIERFMLNDVLFTEGKNVYFIPKERYEWVKRSVGDKNRVRVPTARQTDMMKDFVCLKDANVMFAMSEGYIRKSPAKARRNFVLQSLLLFVIMIALGYFSKEFTVPSLGVFFLCFFIPLFIFLRFGMHWVSFVYGAGPIILFLNILLNEEAREIVLTSVDFSPIYIYYLLVGFYCSLEVL